jgi:hypothetical protein
MVSPTPSSSGYHARRMAEAVSKTGTVCAVDAAEMVQMLAALARGSVTATSARAVAGRRVGLPPASIDLAIMVDITTAEFRSGRARSSARSSRAAASIRQYRAKTRADQARAQDDQAQIRREAATRTGSALQGAAVAASSCSGRRMSGGFAEDG